MLPTVTLPTVLATMPPLEPGQPIALPTAEPGQFAALLTHSTAVLPATMALPGDLEAAAAELAAASAELSEPGKDTPDDGKELPEALPTALSCAVAPGPVLAILPVAVPTAPLVTEGAQTPLPASAPPLPPTAPQPLLRSATPQPQPDPLPAQPGLIPPAQPGLMPPAQPGPMPPAQPGPVPPARLVAVPVLPVPVATEAGQLPLAPRQAPPLRVAATLRLLAEAKPEPIALSAEAPAITGPATPASAPIAVVAAPLAPPLQPPGWTAAPAQAPAEGPQDFAQLIDRLAAAREKAQPLTTTLALAHAEFGPVQLRFSNDRDGVSVALASADPEFARAVQVAVQPVAPTMADNTAAQPRYQGQASGQFESQSGQPHGHGSGQQAARRDHHNRFTAQNASPARPDGGSADSGIFA